VRRLRWKMPLPMRYKRTSRVKPFDNLTVGLDITPQTGKNTSLRVVRHSACAAEGRIVRYPVSA
jgi:hypothetical protein